MEPNDIFGLVNIASALLFIGISLPLVKNKIKMNNWYGIRITKSFSSEENWYKINEYGGKQLIIWSVPLIFVGIICFFIELDDSNKNIMLFVLGVLPITICPVMAVIKTYTYSKSI